MIYEVWDRTSRNCLGVFLERAEALDLVRNIERSHGQVAAESLSMSEEDALGQDVATVNGADLVKLAHERPSFEIRKVSHRGRVSAHTSTA